MFRITALPIQMCLLALCVNTVCKYYWINKQNKNFEESLISPPNLKTHQICSGHNLTEKEEIKQFEHDTVLSSFLKSGCNWGKIAQGWCCWDESRITIQISRNDGQSQRRCDQQFIPRSLPKQRLGLPFSTVHTIWVSPHWSFGTSCGRPRETGEAQVPVHVDREQLCYMLRVDLFAKSVHQVLIRVEECWSFFVKSWLLFRFLV